MSRDVREACAVGRDRSVGVGCQADSELRFSEIAPETLEEWTTTGGRRTGEDERATRARMVAYGRNHVAYAAARGSRRNSARALDLQCPSEVRRSRDVARRAPYVEVR